MLRRVQGSRRVCFLQVPAPLSHETQVLSLDARQVSPGAHKDPPGRGRHMASQAVSFPTADPPRIVLGSGSSSPLPPPVPLLASPQASGQTPAGPHRASRVPGSGGRAQRGAHLPASPSRPGSQTSTLEPAFGPDGSFRDSRNPFPDRKREARWEVGVKCSFSEGRTELRRVLAVQGGSAL